MHSKGCSVQIWTLDEAIEQSKLGYFQYRLLAMCGLAFMTEGFEITLMTFLSACVGVEWELSNISKAMLSGMIFLGIVMGSLFFGWFADKFGRRPAYLYACFIMTVSGLLSAIAPSYYLLVILRTITGFGIGGANVPYDLLAEFLPAPHRGSFLVLAELFWTFGSMSVAALAWVSLDTLGWRFLTFACAVPVLLTSVYSYFYLPESPRWLLSQHREPEANSILRNAAALNGKVVVNFIIVDNTASDLCHAGSYIDLVRTPDARNITLPIWAIWGLYGFTYYGLILFQGRLFSNQDYLSDNVVKGACRFDYASIFYNASSEMFAVLISAALIDSIGRVHSQSLFYFVGGVALIAMGYPMSFRVLLAVSIVARMCSMSGTVGTWVTTPELFPTKLRVTGHCSCAAVSKVCSFWAPFLVSSALSYVELGWILGVLSFAAAAMAHALPETSGGALAETFGDVTDPAAELAFSGARADTRLTSSRAVLYDTTETGARREQPSAQRAIISYTQLAGNLDKGDVTLTISTPNTT